MEFTETRDRVLLERFRGGDRGAFDELFYRYRPLVIGVCRRELKDAELAEDAASAVFLVLHEKTRSLWPTRSIASWLFSVSMLCVQNARRTETRRMRLFSELSPCPPRSTASEGGRDTAVDQALASLKPSEREVILLHFVEDLSVAEISVRLGIKEGACRMRLRRGIASLRSRLGVGGFAIFAGGFGQHGLLSGTFNPEPSAVASKLAGGAVKTMALQSIGKLVAIAACGAGAYCVGAAAISKALPSPPKRVQAASLSSPKPPMAGPHPDGPLEVGRKFEIGFFKNGKLTERKVTEIGRDGYALAKFDLAGWPSFRRGLPKGGVTQADVRRVGAKPSEMVLKFSARYSPPKNGMQHLLIKASFLVGYDKDFAMNYDLVTDTYNPYILMSIRPDELGEFSFTSIGPQMQLLRGNWGWIGQQRQDEALGSQFLHMGTASQEGSNLGIAIQEIDRGARPSP